MKQLQIYLMKKMIRKIDFENKKINLKTKIIALIIIVLGIVYGLDKFFDNYTFVSPIKRLEFQWIIQKRSKVNSTMPKNAQNLTNKAGESGLPMVVDTPKSSSNKIEPSKALTEKDIILSKKHGEILWKIYGLESSWGRNDGCREQGKFNGFGYGQNSYVWNCFDSFEEVVEKVNNWFDKRLKENGNDLAEALCYYNLGLERQINCKYYQSFISL